MYHGADALSGPNSAADHHLGVCVFRPIQGSEARNKKGPDRTLFRYFFSLPDWPTIFVGHTLRALIEAVNRVFITFFNAQRGKKGRSASRGQSDREDVRKCAQDVPPDTNAPSTD
jgi:hypothetical protein